MSIILWIKKLDVKRGLIASPVTAILKNAVCLSLEKMTKKKKKSNENARRKLIEDQSFAQPEA